MLLRQRGAKLCQINGGIHSVDGVFPHTRGMGRGVFKIRCNDAEEPPETEDDDYPYYIG